MTRSPRPLDERRSARQEEWLVAANGGGGGRERLFGDVGPVAGEQAEHGGGVGGAAAKAAGRGNALHDADAERLGLAPERDREGIDGAPGQVLGGRRASLRRKGRCSRSTPMQRVPA